MVNIEEIFKKKYRENKLAHFYILSAPQQCTSPRLFLEDWINNFLFNVYSAEKKVDSYQNYLESVRNGHNDILFISKKDDGKEYLIKDKQFDDFFSFQKYKNFEFRYKFIIVYDSHQISTTLSNKLLKVLEEPQDNTVILFLNPTEKKLLPTIESRAINIKLQENKNKVAISPLLEISEFENWLNKVIITDDSAFEKNYATFMLSKKTKQELITTVRNNKISIKLLDTFKKDKLAQITTAQCMLEWMRISKTSFSKKNEFITELKRFQESQIFNNNSSESMYGLLSKVIS